MQSLNFPKVSGKIEKKKIVLKIFFRATVRKKIMYI